MTIHFFAKSLSAFVTGVPTAPNVKNSRGQSSVDLSRPAEMPQ
jgi:hypothetical protein